MQVRAVAVDRADFCDHFDMIYLMLTIPSAIVTSRKRKLRELYHVATEPNGLPNFDFTNPDAPPTTQVEAQFLVGSDILQYV